MDIRDTIRDTMRRLKFCRLLAGVAAVTILMGAMAIGAGAQDTTGGQSIEAAVEPATDPAEWFDFELSQQSSPIEQWQLLVGLFVPLVVGAIVRQGWTVQEKNGALFGVSLLVTIAGLYLNDQLHSIEELTTSLLTITVMAYGSYQTIWQALPLPQMIESRTGGDPIEAARYRQ